MSKKEKILQLIKAGWSSAAIAADQKVSKSYVWKIAGRNGLSIPRRSISFEKHIEPLRKAGKDLTQIAAELDRTENYIYNIGMRSGVSLKTRKFKIVLSVTEEIKSELIGRAEGQKLQSYILGVLGC